MFFLIFFKKNVWLVKRFYVLSSEWIRQISNVFLGYDWNSHLQFSFRRLISHEIPTSWLFRSQPSGYNAWGKTALQNSYPLPLDSFTSKESHHLDKNKKKLFSIHEYCEKDSLF